ncbi:paraquat-inducible protein B [Haematobacter massiliensis]|uniref:Paraquat-inducible protein B n=1 Tax=Haematobacter massiliensis TaxID=195105 RepID=A0A086YBP6_9RHOB|nr:MlaD family protein [Haematobacter massiliensis]KFI31696.1 paraquat-inducible protein B [Haematobacter massiliensis]OWJ72084.1 paraquat-inducible protein B [Haematobacter massiliensis]OWJ87655.1 paraquat-inducible protein B [Haematobacter massiliensis]QBJ24090.1 MCE family protein [Haematobacter massiliensis]
MTDHGTGRGDGSDGPASLDQRPAREPFWRRIAWIWIVPLVALLVTLGIAWRAYSQRGVLIEVSFANATGVLPGQTALRFRDVDVGVVESTGFSSDLSHVVLRIRVHRDVAPFVDKDARFWIVRPEVSAQGISRLDTVISGVFIEGFWDSRPDGPPVLEFTGLEQMPPGILNGPGTTVTLRVLDPRGLAEGAPVLYRGITVGHLQNIRLAQTGDTVLVDAFVSEPHDRLLTTASVFWDTSGFSVSVGPSGVNLNVSSLAALVQGGVEFTTPISGGGVSRSGQEYRLFPSESTARDSLFTKSEGTQIDVSVLLDSSVRGLTQGAAVHYEALPVGEVTNLAVQIDRGPDGTEEVRQRVILSLVPERMGLPPDTTPEGMYEFLDEQIAQGLRARAVGTGFLGNTMIMELARVEGAEGGTLDRAAEPFPAIPSAPADLSDVTTTAEGLLSRLGNLPIEQLIEAATGLMNSTTAFMMSDDLRQTPAAARDLLEQARALLGSEEVRGAPVAVSELVSEVQGLVADLRTQGIGDKVGIALDETARAAATVTEVGEGLPDLVGRLQTLTDQVAQLNYRELGDRMSGLLAQLEEVAGQEGTRALPAQLGATMDQLAGLLQTLREGGAAETLNRTLQSAQAAADGVARASDQLPAISQRLDAVVRNLDGMIQTYGARSSFSTETLSALRELRRAASAVGSLAQTIERNPRSILTGR